MPFKFLPHTADIKIQVNEATLEKAFVESANALKQAIAENVKVEPKIKKKIKIKAQDLKSFLFDFLEEFIFLVEAEDFLFSEIESLKIDEKNYSLQATITGDKASNYKFTNEVKAITYYDMLIEKDKKGWKIVYVVDV